MRIFLSLGMIVLFVFNMNAQLNDYKYIVIPKRFDDFKEVNQHQTSTLVKHLFSANGFNTVYDDAIPDELYANRCLGLKLKLDNQSSMFTTKTVLILEDCNGKSIFLTQEGRSREKEFKISYQEAITQSFKSIEALNYEYSGKNDPETVTLSYKNDVKNLSEESKTVTSTAVIPKKPVVEQEATIENQSFKSIEPQESNYEKGSNETQVAVSEVATVDEQRYEDKTPKQSTMIKAPQTNTLGSKLEDLGVMYAQELPTGFQLVDSSPKIVMTLFKTSMKDVYAAKFGELNGIVFKRDEKWLFDYTEGQALIQKELNIKF